MDIIISFYNTWSTPGCPSLGLLNAETMSFRVLELPPEVPKTGIMGLAISSSYVFTCLQYSCEGTKAFLSPPGLLVFDRNNFKLIHYYIFQLVKDIHSLSLSKDESTLFVVSSGTDEIIELKLDGANVVSEKVFWRPELDGERSDNYHINAIYQWKGDFLVSGFGKKSKDGDWSSACNGFIYNISKEEQIISGLEQPHSIAAIGEHLAFCESRKKKLRLLNDERTIELPGYVRGLCMASGKIFIGISARRKKSKSTGKLVKQGTTDLVECSISRIIPETLHVEKTVSLKNYAKEIYDLLPVEETINWPVCEPKNYFSLFEETWTNQVKIALQEMHETIPEGEVLILVDDNTWENGENILPNHRRLPFLERDGIYWGAPETDEIAISELKRMKNEEGVNFIAFGWPSFWWLDNYYGFSEYLGIYYKCVLKNDRLIIFDLQSSLSVVN